MDPKYGTHKLCADAAECDRLRARVAELEADLRLSESRECTCEPDHDIQVARARVAELERGIDEGDAARAALQQTVAELEAERDEARKETLMLRRKLHPDMIDDAEEMTHEEMIVARARREALEEAAREYPGSFYVWGEAAKDVKKWLHTLAAQEKEAGRE